MAGMGRFQPAVNPPEGVRFYVNDINLIERYLRPRVVTNAVSPQSIIEDKLNFFTTHPDGMEHNTQIYYPPHQYWYYADRVVLHGNRPVRTLPDHDDRWVYFSTKAIRRGFQIIGHKECIQLKTPAGLHTGYSIHEYRLASENFQPIVLVHLIYEQAKNERLPQAPVVDPLNIGGGAHHLGNIQVAAQGNVQIGGQHQGNGQGEAGVHGLGNIEEGWMFDAGDI